MTTFSWAVFRSTLSAALLAHVEGSPFVVQASIGDKLIRYDTVEAAMKAIEKSYQLEAMETSGTPSTMTSYGRHRRY